jgi:two-component system CheB/CheR fusion protein
MLPEKPHHIIAIGASAGGMEEINSFFDHTPLDGVSYIIIQHLSSDFKSRMVELLARHSRLVVKEAENGMTVNSNEVYLIPNDKFMTISDNKLYLTDKVKIKSPHLTINGFFNSLAEDYGNKAIAVILSGLGSDGSEGALAIKKAGGMVIARNPETSEFSSMPSSAIATGAVDFILEPDLMPNAIEDYIKYGGSLLTDGKDDEKNITAIINFIKAKLPFDFTDYKQTTILRRTKRRAAQANFTTLENYFEFLKSTPGEAEALAKDFLISVTSFFRDKEAFDYIQTNIIPDLLVKLTPGEELKMWVAGCATGEEVYSIAILLSEQLTGNFLDTKVKIFATDIDSVALAQAGKGLYGDGIEKNITAERLENFFIKEGANYRIKPAIRKMVICANHDLVKNPPYCNMHFISCRNLLIYMTPVLQKRIFAMLLFGLKMDGYLFLGSSENPMPIIKNLDVVNKKWKIYRNIEKKKAVEFDAFSFPELIDIKRTPSLFSKEDVSWKSSNNLAESVNTALANGLDCLVVCVDENGNVLKSFGDTTRYLLQKNFTSKLEELLPKPLAVAFITLSAEALKTGERTFVNGINIKYGSVVTSVTLSVSPLPVKKGQPQLLMATFAKENQTGQQSNIGSVFDENIYLSMSPIWRRN